MFDWKAVALICALVNGLCMVLDRWVLPSGKSRIQVWLLQVLEDLEKSSVRVLPRLIAIFARRTWFRVFGFRFWSLRSMVLLATISVCLTIGAIVVGDATEAFRFGGNVLDRILRLLPGITPREGLILISVNLLFDLSTVQCTLFVLRHLSARIHSLKALAWIALDVVMAHLFAFLCLAAALVASIYYPGSDVSLGMVCTAILDGDMGLSAYFYACTTLLPTLAFMSILLLAYLAKLATAFVMLYCQLANQRKAIDARIFTILGVMTLPIGAAAALLHHWFWAPT